MFPTIFNVSSDCSLDCLIFLSAIVGGMIEEVTDSYSTSIL